MPTTRYHDGTVGVFAGPASPTGYCFTTGFNDTSLNNEQALEKTLQSSGNRVVYWGSPGHLASMKALGLIKD